MGAQHRVNFPTFCCPICNVLSAELFQISPRFLELASQQAYLQRIQDPPKSPFLETTDPLFHRAGSPQIHEYPEQLFSRCCGPRTNSTTFVPTAFPHGWWWRPSTKEEGNGFLSYFCNRERAPDPRTAPQTRTKIGKPGQSGFAWEY